MKTKDRTSSDATSRRMAASERCYQQIRWMLMAAQIPEGVRLGEVEWANRLGTHRAAVREAFMLLAHEGSLRQGEKGGFFSPVFEQRDHTEISEARAVLEIGAMRIIHARGVSTTELAPLGEICDTMALLLGADMWLGFIEADRRFHEKIIELTGNDHLIGMYSRASLPHRLPASNTPDELRENFRVTLEDHRVIYQLMLDGKIVEAISKMEDHLELNGKLLWRLS